MTETRIPVNFISDAELTQIQHVGPRIANIIGRFRESKGNIDQNTLEFLMRRPLSAELLSVLDFTPNTALKPDIGECDKPVQQMLTVERLPHIFQMKMEHHSAGTLSQCTGTGSDTEEEDDPDPNQQGLIADDQSLTPFQQNQVREAERLMAEAALILTQVKESKESSEKSTQPTLLDLGKQTSENIEEAVTLLPSVPQTPIRTQMDRPLIRPRRQSSYQELRPVPAPRGLTREAEMQPSYSPMVNRRQGRDIGGVYEDELTAAGPAAMAQNALVPQSAQVTSQHRRPALKDIPKSMSYDGKSNWQSFEMKFIQYANAYEWSDEDCKICLLHCLTGKALGYCARIMRTQSDLPYRSLLKKLQERFGAELQASAQAKFNQATQSHSETLEDWADRVQQLAVEAFEGLPKAYANEQAIARFCQGLSDIDAGHSTFMKSHDTIEKAMNDIRLYQHSRKDMLRRRNKRDTPPIAVEDYQEAQVCSVAKQADNPDKLDSLQKQMNELKDMVANMTTRRPRGRQGAQRQKPKGNCYLCDDPNHFVRDCPNRPKSHLNVKGSAGTAEARSKRKADN